MGLMRPTHPCLAVSASRDVDFTLVIVVPIRSGGDVTDVVVVSIGQKKPARKASEQAHEASLTLPMPRRWWWRRRRRR
jgi:hypothetical protein